MEEEGEGKPHMHRDAKHFRNFLYVRSVKRCVALGPRHASIGLWCLGCIMPRMSRVRRATRQARKPEATASQLIFRGFCALCGNHSNSIEEVQKKLETHRKSLEAVASKRKNCFLGTEQISSSASTSSKELLVVQNFCWISSKEFPHPFHGF